MPTLELFSDYRPNAGQAKFHASRAPFKCGLAGVGGGKTHALCVEALALALANPGEAGVIVAPTHDMVIGTTLESLRRCLPTGGAGPFGSPLVADWSARERRMRLINGATVRFRSAHDPEHLRGPNLAWFAMDEAARCPRAAWEVLLARVRVRTARRAAGIAVTTPRGFDWVYEEFARESPESGVRSPKSASQHPASDFGLRTPDFGLRELVRWSTAENAANLRPGYVEELRAAYPDRLARQELDACFESFRGAVFPEFRRSLAPEGNLLPWEFRSGSAAWVGIDFGFRRPAAVWVAPGEGDAFVIVDEFLGEDCPVQRLAAEIRSRPYRLLGAFGDPAGAGRHGSGDSDLRTLRDAGVPVAVCTDPQRTRLMFGIGLLQGLLLSAEGRRRLFLAVDGAGRCRVPGVMAALESYAWPEARPGRPVAEEPVKDGVHDHPLDALRYWAINRLRPPAALTGRCGVR